jgi:hypothetical protein
MGKPPINGPFPMAMLNNQMVIGSKVIKPNWAAPLFFGSYRLDQHAEPLAPFPHGY